MEKTFGKHNWLILILFGIIGQIAWSVENMYFNLFVFETIDANLDAITWMVQLSGITATVTTLIAGTLSDKWGNRRRFIAWGYIIWGITVALFGFLSKESVMKVFNMSEGRAIALAIILVIALDCVMTVFGSTANDAAYNAWVTDNTQEHFRGKVEGVVAVLPLIAMLIVAGGFGILVSFIGYAGLFFGLGAVISICGIIGLFIIKDSPFLQRNGSFKDIFYGFKPSVIKTNKPLYISLIIMGIYGIACQIFMPYLIIYMTTYLGFNVVEYSVVFGAAIILGAVLNVLFGAVTDRMDKAKLLYAAAGIMAIGLLGMYLFRFDNKLVTLITFGVAGFIMIAGYILVSALCGALVRDYTPVSDAGKLQGVRMVFSVLIPMLLGPTIGNAINRAAGNFLPDNASSADIMTTKFIPAPEIFLAGAIAAVIMFAVIPLLVKVREKAKGGEKQCD